MKEDWRRWSYTIINVFFWIESSHKKIFIVEALMILGFLPLGPEQTPLLPSPRKGHVPKLLYLSYWVYYSSNSKPKSIPHIQQHKRKKNEEDRIFPLVDTHNEMGLSRNLILSARGLISLFLMFLEVKKSV